MTYLAIHGESWPDSIPIEIIEVAKNYGLFGKSQVEKVGFLQTSFGSLAIVPRFFREWIPLASPNSISNQILQFIKILDKYERQRRFIDQTNLNHNISYGNPKILNNYILLKELILDYSTNGQLKDNKWSIENNSTKNISWDNTISSNQWIQTVGDSNFLPINIVSKIQNRSREDDISHIHHRLINIAIETLKLSNIKKIKISQQTIPIKIAIQKLRSELSRTFKRRDKSVIKTMIKILENYYNETSLINNTNHDFYILTNFELVWEDLIRTGFDKKAVEIKLPIGIYENKNKQIFDGIRPIPDVLLLIDSNSKLMTIMDGKYYNINNASAQDHYKQIIYSKLLKTAGWNINYNIIVFPIMNQKYSKMINEIGIHHWENFNNSKVYEIEIDYDFLAKIYIGEISVICYDDFLKENIST